MNSDNICFGIDFGTTNSCISIWYKNEAILIKDFDGSNIIPTVIEINDTKKIIGGEAYKRKEIFEKLTLDNFVIYEIKKLIGKKYSDLNEDQINLLGYNLKPDKNDNILIVNNNKEYYIDEIITHIFMSFYHFSNKFLSDKFNIELNIKNTIISVPARFNDSQRELIKSCASNAGFCVLRLINEPTAAALCYGIGKNLSEEQNIIVFDFGGGTLDISLLKIFENNYEVIGSSGNSNLGGSDFDRKIMEYCVQKFIENNELNIEKFLEDVSEINLQKLKYLSEKAKISLSDVLHTQIIINDFYDNKPLRIPLSRDDFNIMCRDLIALMIKPIDELLSICEMDKKDINEIVMVGGMTKMPSISNNVELYFGKELNCSIDPDNVVAIGASIYGHLLVNKESIEDKLLLIDRTSLSIGLETSGGIMDILIPRGSIIPIKKIKKYTTDTDDMDSIMVKIFEGERKFTKDNFLIGDFFLTGIEKTKRGIPEFQITFSIDHNGIIKIKAEDLNNTLNKKSIQITGNKQNLSSEQMDIIIENAKLMDKIDRLDKTKKMFHFNLIDDCKKILDNIKNDELKIENDTRETIIKNITELLSWLENTKYEEIDIDKYKDTIQEFKTKYSIFLIHNNISTFNVKTANEENKDGSDNIGVKIYDDEENIKKYQEQVLYIRNILEEYNNIKIDLNKLYKAEFYIDKQIQIFNYCKSENEIILENKNICNIPDNNILLLNKISTNDSELVNSTLNELTIFDNTSNKYVNEIINDMNDNIKLINKEEIIEFLIKTCNNVCEFTSNLLTEFFTNNKLNDDIVNNFINDLYEKDCYYKKEFSIYEECFDIVIKISNILDNKENIYLEMLEIENINLSQEDIENKLEIILEYQKILHKIKNKYGEYVEYDNDYLKKILNILKVL
jgi:molecular chaperone DnaK (HSP70)